MLTLQQCTLPPMLYAQGVWLRDLFMMVAIYFTRASFYTNWDATLATGGVKMKAT